MRFSASVNIMASSNSVWNAVCDIKNASRMISGINEIEVLEDPKDGLVGFKWRETRTMFGKEVIETMWITDCEEEVYYRTRAENGGSIYISEIRITPLTENEVTLTMMFNGDAQTFVAKVVSFVMMPFFKGSMVKMLEKDLLDIKAFVE